MLRRYAIPEAFAPLALEEVDRTASLTVASVAVPAVGGEIVYVFLYNPITGAFDLDPLYPPTVDLGQTIGIAARGNNITPYDQNMRMDCVVTAPDGISFTLVGKVALAIGDSYWNWFFTWPANQVGAYTAVLILYAESVV